MAKFKSVYAINKRIPFVFGEIAGDAEGVFEADGEEFVSVLSGIFDCIDAPPAPASTSTKKQVIPEAVKTEE